MDLAIPLGQPNTEQARVKAVIADHSFVMNADAQFTCTSTLTSYYPGAATFAAPSIDTDGMWDESNGWVTFKTAGLWMVRMGVGWSDNANTGQVAVGVAKNSTPDMLAENRIWSGASYQTAHEVSYLGRFVIGDYIRMRLVQDRGGGQSTSSTYWKTFINAWRVAP
jgi:hypothetical protein